MICLVSLPEGKKVGRNKMVSFPLPLEVVFVFLVGGELPQENVCIKGMKRLLLVHFRTGQMSDLFFERIIFSLTFYLKDVGEKF